MSRKILFVLALATPVLSLSAHAEKVRSADSMTRHCKGKTEDGDKIKADFQLLVDNGLLTIDSKDYRLEFKSESAKGYKYTSDEHGGLEIKVDTKGRYLIGESHKLGKFSLKCRPSVSADPDEGSDDTLEPEVYFANDREK